MDNNKQFREYDKADDLVIQTYKLNHQYQSLEFVNEKLDEYCRNFNICKMTIWDAINKLDKIIDESDPDLGLNQMYHAFQSAEGLRKLYPEPEKDYLHLVGLIHDLGKVLLLPEFGSLPQWSVVGDTFPVGCAYSDKIVYNHFFELNPDKKNMICNSKYGIYKPNCGIDNILLSFGHDNYLYDVLKHNKCEIPEEGLKIIKYHSFYSWHRENQYEYLMNDEDYKIRDLCRQFSDCDLYTKNDNNKLDIDKLKPYYDGLIKKYFPNELLEW